MMQTTLASAAPTSVASARSAGQDTVSSAQSALFDRVIDGLTILDAIKTTGNIPGLNLTTGLAALAAFRSGYALGTHLDATITESMDGKTLGAAVYDWTHGVQD
jgi:hypothetical protein